MGWDIAVGPGGLLEGGQGVGGWVGGWSDSRTLTRPWSRLRASAAASSRCSRCDHSHRRGRSAATRDAGPPAWVPVALV